MTLSGHILRPQVFQIKRSVAEIEKPGSIEKQEGVNRVADTENA